MSNKNSAAAAALVSVVGQLALQVSGYQSMQAAVALGGVTVLLGAWWLIEVLRERRARLRPSDVTVRSQFIPLHEVARDLYAEARLHWPFWARAAEKLSGLNRQGGNEDEILDWVGTWIRARVELHGVRPPSNRTELIPDTHGDFSGGARIYKADSNEYRDLFVSAPDLSRLTDEIRVGGKSPSPAQRTEAEKLQRMQDDVDELRTLDKRRRVLEQSKGNLNNFLREAKDQYRTADFFVRTLNELSPNVPFSGTAAMHPESFDRLTKLIRRGINVARESNFANDFEAPNFTAPPDTNLRQDNKSGTTVFYKNDNWPYMAQVASFMDRSAQVIRRLDGPLFLIAEELNVTDQKIATILSRLSSQ